MVSLLHSPFVFNFQCILSKIGLRDDPVKMSTPHIERSLSTLTSSKENADPHTRDFPWFSGL